MFKKFVFSLLFILPSLAAANEPVDWQLGFQKSASKSMSDIIWFHDYMLLPIITAITCLLYTSPSPRDVEESRMPSSA